MPQGTALTMAAWGMKVVICVSSPAEVLCPCWSLSCAVAPSLVPTTAIGKGQSGCKTGQRSVLLSLRWLPTWAQRVGPRAMAPAPGSTAHPRLSLRHRRAGECHARTLAYAVVVVPRILVGVARDSVPEPVRCARCVRRRLRHGCQQRVKALVLARVKAPWQE